MGGSTTNGWSGFLSSISPSSADGPQATYSSGAFTLAAMVPKTLMYGYGCCVLALLLAQATVQIVW